MNSHFILGMISHKNKKKGNNAAVPSKAELEKTNPVTPANKTPARTKHTTPSKSQTPAQKLARI